MRTRAKRLLLAAAALLLAGAGSCLLLRDFLFYRAADDDQLKKYKPMGTDTSAFLDGQAAWLQIFDTGIDDPVMQAADNDYYLAHDPYGKDFAGGSIFLDFQNAPGFSDPYNVIYGHHMDRGYRFGALDDFLEEAFFDEHRRGKLTTADGKVFSLSLFAAVTADAGDGTIFEPLTKTETDKTDEETRKTRRRKEELLLAIREKALYWREPEAAADAAMIALVTCKAPGTNGRTAVIGMLRPEKM